MDERENPRDGGMEGLEMNKQIVATGLLLSLFVSFGVLAHHSRTTFFDMSQTVELEGEITRVQWRNPHVRYWIQTDPEYGGAVWELETTPPSILERQGISRDILAAGTRVRVAGPPSRLVENAMEASHVLLPDGREVLLHTGRAPLWTNRTVERAVQEFEEDVVRVAEATANGIFRVWSRPAIGPDRPPFWLGDYPLTETARAVSSVWDPVTGIDIGCKPKIMPAIMASSYPFEFVDEGDHLRLLVEEFDQERIIHLRRTTAGEVLPTPLGYSVGYWEQGDLVVTTTHIDSLDFGSDGIPLSESVQTLERFSLSPDEHRLNYEITVTDSGIFTESITMTSHWIWRAGEMIKPYDCIETPGSWTDRRD